MPAISNIHLHFSSRIGPELARLIAEHAPQRQGDEYFCRKCGKRWSIDEEEPECS